MPDDGEIRSDDPEERWRVAQNTPPDEQPAGISIVGRFDINNFQSNGMALFVDAHNHLCAKFPDGSINYVVMSAVPPERGEQILAPCYNGQKTKEQSSVPEEPKLKIGKPRLLWDHLEEDE